MKSSVSLVVLTDIDGTLLDHRTYTFAPVVPAIRLLERRHIPLVLCSSKTRAEIVRLQARLGVRHPFISENGGGLFLPLGYFRFPVPGARVVEDYLAIEFGRPYCETVRALRSAAEVVHARVVGFSDMSPTEVSERCALSLAEAELAKQREYDEPFVVEDPAAYGPLSERLQEAGLHCTTGGRFAHVSGATDKARPVGLVRMLYRRTARRRVVLVGLGDALNDLSLLRAVEVPIIVRNHAAGVTDDLARAVPYARITDDEGPFGWRWAVEQIVRQLALPQG